VCVYIYIIYFYKSDVCMRVYTYTRDYKERRALDRVRLVGEGLKPFSDP